MIHYLFDDVNFKSIEDLDDLSEPVKNYNVIKICKNKVTKTCGAILAHYFAQIQVSNGYKFEFHPGSQPRTFQQIHSKGNVIFALILCDECCKNELRLYTMKENDFNVIFQNCESILCKRKSMQTVFITLALLAITFNMFVFSWYYIFFVIFIIILLYINNNYIISTPKVILCAHKQQNLQDVDKKYSRTNDDPIKRLSTYDFY